MIQLDGSKITGGGQILRTALGLSAHTNKPFRMFNIRAGRPKPGLMPQHLAAVKLMQELCNAEVQGAYVGSSEITFIPRGFTPVEKDVHIGTAGSVTLLSQSLIIAGFGHKKTTYRIHGGTDVRYAMPADYLRYIIAPALSSYGNISVETKKRGFFPKGGGQLELTVGAVQKPKPVTYIQRGHFESITIYVVASYELMDQQVCEDIERHARFYLSGLGVPINVRASYVRSLDAKYSVVACATHNDGKPLNLIGASALSDDVGSPQEACEKLARQLKGRLDSTGVVDEHVADNLIPFMALHGGEIEATRISTHIRANIAVAEEFLPAKFVIHNNRITVSRQG